MTRSGSRKKYRQNAARIQSGAENQGPASQATIPPAAPRPTA
jgi:hypothetical protein